jgi:hypothetical protein
MQERTAIPDELLNVGILRINEAGSYSLDTGELVRQRFSMMRTTTRERFMRGMSCLKPIQLSSVRDRVVEYLLARGIYTAATVASIPRRFAHRRPHMTQRQDVARSRHARERYPQPLSRITKLSDRVRPATAFTYPLA